MNGTVLMGNTNITQSITVNSDQVYAAGYYTDNGNTVFGPGGFMNISGCVQLNGVLIVSPALALALRTSHGLTWPQVSSDTPSGVLIESGSGCISGQFSAVTTTGTCTVASASYTTSTVSISFAPDPSCAATFPTWAIAVIVFAVLVLLVAAAIIVRALRLRKSRELMVPLDNLGSSGSQASMLRDDSARSLQRNDSAPSLQRSGSIQRNDSYQGATPLRSRAAE
jgi:hypothetical protein